MPLEPSGLSPEEGYAAAYVVLLGKGNHEVTSSWTTPYGHVCQTTLAITRSNITFIGKGIGETTILG